MKLKLKLNICSPQPVTQFQTSEAVLAQNHGPASKQGCEVDGRDGAHLSKTPSSPGGRSNMQQANLHRSVNDISRQYRPQSSGCQHVQLMEPVSNSDQRAITRSKGQAKEVQFTPVEGAQSAGSKNSVSAVFRNSDTAEADSIITETPKRQLKPSQTQ